VVAPPFGDVEVQYHSGLSVSCRPKWDTPEHAGALLTISAESG
jgi:hypothetical protein